MERTVIFEAKYGVDIREFSSTHDVDTFLEKKLGRPLKVVSMCGIPIVDYPNIDEEIDKALQKRCK